MRYRVDDLATRAGLSVDTIRYYQTKGLLPRPEREGRVAWYTDAHLARLDRIHELKDQGFSLASIARLLDAGLPAGDEALVAALAAAPPDERLLTLEDLAERTGVSVALLEVIEREGFLVPRAVGGQARYTAADADALAAGLQLLETGVPLGEVLDLARRYDQVMQPVADEAVELFIRFVRDPIHGTAASEQEASERLVTAFRTMLPATGAIVAHHFRSLLLRSAQARIERDGHEAEIAVARAESARALGG